MTSGRATVRVVSAGALSTIQDCGRRDVARYGVSPSGASDWFSARAANLLVGNDPCAPLLETTLNGIAFDIERHTNIAVTGAEAALEIGGSRARLWQAHWVAAGARVKVGLPLRGVRSYIAVAGGFDVPLVLGSASTDFGSGFGGFKGRALRAGDALSICSPGLLRPGRAQEPGTTSVNAPTAFRREAIPVWNSPAVLRIVPGPHRCALADSAWMQLLSREWSVSSRSTRQGLALEGESLQTRATDVVSAGACAGCVQITSAGLPVVLLAEHQTTAGYALVGCVISADLPHAAQARTGEAVRFELVSLAQAAVSHDVLERKLASGMTSGPAEDLSTGFFEGL